MPDFDAGFKIVAREAGRELSRLGEVETDTWEPITGEVHAAERLADRAFRARHGGEEFVVYMEAYTRWSKNAPWSVLAKSGLLSERERLPCKSLVYVLLPRGYRPQRGQFRLKVDGKKTQQVWFQEICLWKFKPQVEWESSPGLMALYPLFQHQRAPDEAIAHAANCIKGHATDKIREADLLTVLAIFGKLVDPGSHPLDIIGREAMKESKFYQEIQEESRQETRQADLVDVLEARFGKGSAHSFEEAIRIVRDEADLRELLRGASKCRSLDGFRRLLKRVTKV